MDEREVYYIEYNRFNGKPRIVSKTKYWMTDGALFIGLYAFLLIALLIMGEQFLVIGLIASIGAFMVWIYIFNNGREEARKYRAKMMAAEAAKAKKLND